MFLPHWNEEGGESLKAESVSAHNMPVPFNNPLKSSIIMYTVPTVQEYISENGH